MNLAPREKRTILIGLALAVVVGGYSWVVRPLVRKLRGASTSTEHLRGQFADARTRIARYETVRREMNALAGSLHIEVPDVPPPDQMERLVQRLEQMAGRCNVQIRNITQLKSQARATATRGPARTEMKLDLNCQSGTAGLVRFIDSLETGGLPIVVDQISITTTGGRTSTGSSGPPTGSGGPPTGSSGSERYPGRGSRGSQRREIQASLKVYTYLFPGEKAAEKAQQ